MAEVSAQSAVLAQIRRRKGEENVARRAVDETYDRHLRPAQDVLLGRNRMLTAAIIGALAEGFSIKAIADAYEHPCDMTFVEAISRDVRVFVGELVREYEDRRSHG